MLDRVIKGGKIVDGSGGEPFYGDIGISDGTIVEVGKVTDSAREVIDADGAIVTPGWIDSHTHYDGQVTWDDTLETSQTNGITTAIAGNCGVGFAPMRPGSSDALIDLMEGVEDIPGTALFEGVPWGSWETFPEYMEFVSKLHWSIDMGFQIGHGPLRLYVMGERAYAPEADARAATPEDLAAMAKAVEEATRAGALGFSTSRILFHRALSGYSVPGTYAPDEELSSILGGMRAGGGGVLQAIPGGGVVGEQDPWLLTDEVRLFCRLSAQFGVDVTFTLFQDGAHPERWRDAMAIAAEGRSSGASVTPMVSPRCSSILTSLRSYHLFMLRPTFRRLAQLPLGELVREMTKPEVKAAILAEPDAIDVGSGSMESALVPLFKTSLDRTFAMGDPIDYEPTADQAIGALAQAAGREPVEYFYDFLLQQGGTTVGQYFIANYANGNLDVVREMLDNDNTVSGLSDSGAHVRMICDAANATFHLTHWARDRKRGPTLPLEKVVAKITSAPARVFGLHDRGLLVPGKRADVNIVDFEHLEIQRPFVRADLPAGGSRFLQPSTGFIATLVRGVPTVVEDKDTGARPGQLARRTA